MKVHVDLQTQRRARVLASPPEFFASPSQIVWSVELTDVEKLQALEVWLDQERLAYRQSRDPAHTDHIREIKSAITVVQIKQDPHVQRG